MAAIILPHRWNVQPQGPAGVHWSSPFAKNLIVAWHGAAPWLNGATELACTLKNGIAPGDMPGQSLKFEGTTGSTTCHYVSIPWIFGTLANGGGFSMVNIYQEQDPIGNYRRHLRIYNGGGERVRIFHEATGASIGYRVLDGTGGGSDTRTSTGSVANAGVYTIGVAAKWEASATVHCYRGDAYASSTFAATGYPQPGIAAATEIGLGTDDAYVPGFIDGALWLIWNRGLERHELREIVKFPWQLFRPLRRRLYFAPAAVPPAATFEQEGFRWRYDDGDEDGATFSAAQDEHSAASIGIRKRLRTIVNVTGTPSTEEFELQYRRVGSPSEDWRKVN